MRNMQAARKKRNDLAQRREPVFSTARVASAAVLSALVLTSFSAHPVPRNKVLISVKTHSADAHKTRDQLRKLLNTYDLAPYIFTRSVIIDADTIPHSHPQLALHTRHRNDPELLLSTFVHEQLHWYLDANPKKKDAAVAALKVLFPKLPVGFPEGAKSLQSSYEHMLVNTLEIRAVGRLMGELRAKQVLDFWCTDHYTALYALVRDRREDVMKILRAEDLVPDAKPAVHHHHHGDDDK